MKSCLLSQHHWWKCPLMLQAIGSPLTSGKPTGPLAASESIQVFVLMMSFTITQRAFFLMEYINIYLRTYSFLSPAFLSFFLFGCLARLVGSQFPDERSNLCPLQRKLGVLTTGPPGNFPENFFKSGDAQALSNWIGLRGECLGHQYFF